MAVVQIPTFETPFYSFQIALEGRSYKFEFRYNQREDAWYLSVYSAEGVELALGVKVVCNRDLLRRFADVRLPPGTLTAIPSGTEKSPPGLSELGVGKRVTLTYLTSDET